MTSYNRVFFNKWSYITPSITCFFFRPTSWKLHMCQGRSTPWSLGMGNLPPLMTGILIMGPYKPLRTWVDDHPLLYGNNGSLDPSTYIFSCDFFFTYRDPGRKIRSDHHGMTQETPRGPSLMDYFLTISRKESFPKISRKGATIKPPTIFQGLKKTPSSVRLHFTVFFLSLCHPFMH